LFRLFFFVVGSAGSIVTVAAVAVAVLTVTGSPDACRNSGVVATTQGAAVAERKWATFRAELATNGTAEVTLTEQEVTGRANRWVDDRKLPVEDLRIFFCRPDGDHPDGQGQMTASIGAGPLSTSVLVDATLDTSAPGDPIRILEVRAGNLPGFATGWADGRVGQIVDDAAVDFAENITKVTFDDGTVTIRGKSRA
jgi:hypothetical protein